ncbi:MAG: bacillithiol biosynthesis deacetylase BshB1 [Deinococcaceae bacterium]
MNVIWGSQQPLDILAIAPHPDDAEIGAGGTLIKAAQSGKHVGIIELTAGEMGTLGTPEERLAETREAARIMGLTFRGNLGLADGYLDTAEPSARSLAAAFRILRPQKVLLPHPNDRHPDHIASFHLGKRAIHFAGLSKAPVEHTPIRIQNVLCYQGNAPIDADCLVDVSAQIPIWEQSVMAHRSQFSGAAVSETVTPHILERRKARMKYWGTFVGVDYAEAFWSELPILMDF